jgi:hypothetical protein
MTLCDSNLTLEPGDFTKRNFTADPFGPTHECTDFSTVYETMKEAYDVWLGS